MIDGEDEKVRDQCSHNMWQTLRELPDHQTKHRKRKQAKVPKTLLEPSKDSLDKDEYKEEPTN